MNSYLYWLLVVLVLVFIISSYVFYNWCLTHAPMMITKPYAGSIASSNMTNSFISSTVMDNSSRPGGIHISNMPYLSEKRVNMTLMMFLYPESISQKKTESVPSLPTMSFQEQNKFSRAIILEQGSDNLSIEYDSFLNELVLRIRIIYGTEGTEMKQHEEFRVRGMLRLQKWNMVTVVFDNRHLDLYLDNKLYRSWVLMNVPLISDSTWTLFPGTIPFDGIISTVRFFDYAVIKSDIPRLYDFYKSSPTTPGSTWWWWIPTISYWRVY